MSQWGKLDRVEQTSNVSANNASTLVVSTKGAFTEANSFYVGYAIVIANVDYRIETIANVGNLFLDTAYIGANTTTGNVAVQQGPKWLRTNGWGANASIGRGANTVNIRNVYGIDRIEIASANNKANGFSQTGWTTYKTYTTTQGAVRRKAEVLVAMSKNFNANATGVLQTDANDDNIVYDL